MQKQYTTSGKGKTILATAAIIALIIAAWLFLSSFTPAESWPPDKVYPMVNQHIEWTGAGYGRR